MINYWLYEAFLVLISLCGILVIISRSPINAVLFLCGMYLAGGGIFLLLDHYFLGLTLIIVYVGAIAILFLFTIFMINVRLTLQLGSFARSPMGFGEAHPGINPAALAAGIAILLLSGFALYFFLFADSSLFWGNSNKPSVADLNSQSIPLEPILSSFTGNSYNSPILELGYNGQAMAHAEQTSRLFINGGTWENSLRSIYASDWSNLLGRPSDLTMLANMIFYAYPLALILVGFLLLVVMVAIIKIHLDAH